MKVAIFGKPFGEKATSYIEELFFQLFDNHIEVIVYEKYFDFLDQQLKVNFKPLTFTTAAEIATCDFVICMGGDGTILDATTLVRDSGVPILGINTGRLGFLANVAKEEIKTAVHDLLSGNYSIDQRTMLAIDTEANLFGDMNFALNEVTISRKDTTSMITIHTYLDDKFLCSYWADGLIISTPTGSTGYSLSCGGPIIMPGSENFILTPIAPHNLNIRPFVINEKNRISLRVEGRSTEFLVSLDSRTMTIDDSVELKVRKNEFKIGLVETHAQDFMRTLRNKLYWGMDKRN
jgi:NAD+ kinase